MRVAASPAPQTRLEVIGVRKSFGRVAALAGIDLVVKPGELFCLLGPSGCGKTTLLNVIGGLLEPDEGSLRLGGRDITAVPMQKRNIGIVFQNYALFPHLTVGANIAFGMELRGHSRDKVGRRVQELLELTHLEGKAERYPKQLSGGEQQRVAVARSLAIDPTLLLLDEPLSNLDAKLRVELRSELRRVQREAQVTTILVTHDQDEAFAVGDRVGLMRSGSLVQVGIPEQLYAQPTSEFAARFIGESNLLSGDTTTHNDHPMIRCCGQLIPLPIAAGNVARATLLIRPERTLVQLTHPGTEPAVPGTIREVVYTGLGWRYVIDSALGALLSFEVGPGHRVAPGDPVYVIWRVADSILLPSEAQAPS